MATNAVIHVGMGVTMAGMVGASSVLVTQLIFHGVAHPYNNTLKVKKKDTTTNIIL